jgi:hypothetical protein
MLTWCEWTMEMHVCTHGGCVDGDPGMGRGKANGHRPVCTTVSIPPMPLYTHTQGQKGPQFLQRAGQGGVLREGVATCPVRPPGVARQISKGGGIRPDTAPSPKLADAMHCAEWVTMQMVMGGHAYGQQSLREWATK